MTVELPIFPLPIVLYPREERPLHIFETRYKDMVRFCLDEDIAFGMILVLDGKFAHTGCTARIEKVLHIFEDGRMDILVKGEMRFRLLEIEQEHSYLTGKVQYFREPMLTLRRSLREKVVAQHLKWMEMTHEKFRLHDYEVDWVSYIIASQLPLSIEKKQQILHTPAENDRLAILATYLEEQLPKVGKVIQTQRIIRSDGHTSALPPDMKFNFEKE